MGVIKAKNSAGEWVNVASAEATTITNELTGELKIASKEIAYADQKNSIDLSEYISGNEEFMIYFATATSKSQSNSEPHIWLKSEGTGVIRNLGNLQALYSEAVFNTLFPKDTSAGFTISYDEDTKVLTIVDDTYYYITSFTLLYTGVKEA